MAESDRRKQGRGVLCSLFNSLGLALTCVLSKFSAVFNPFVLLMWSTGSSFLYLCSMIRKDDLRQLTRVKTWDERLAMAICVLFLPACSICGYMSIVYMEFADSFAITQSNVVICSLLAWIILKEPLFWIDWLCLLLSTSGVLLIARPHFLFGFSKSFEEPSDVINMTSSSEVINIYENRWKGVLYSLGSALTSSFFGVARRKIKNVNNMALLFTQTGLAFPMHLTLATTVRIPGVAPGFACGSALDKLFLSSAGILHGLCVMCNFVLFRCLPVVSAMTLKALSSVFSYILQISFNLEPISWLSMLGSVLIVTSVFAKVIYIKCISVQPLQKTTDERWAKIKCKNNNAQDISHIEYTCYVK